MFDPRITPYGSLWRAAFAVAVFDLQRETGDQRELTREWLHEMLSKFGALDATALLSRWLDRGDLAARDQLRKMFAASHATPYRTEDIDPAHRPETDLAHRPEKTAVKTAVSQTQATALGDGQRAEQQHRRRRRGKQSAKPARRPAPPINVEQQNKRAAAILAKRDRAKKLTRQRVGEERARRWRRMTPEERSARRARMSEAQRLSWAKLDDDGRAARVAAITAGRERKRIARLERVAALRAQAMAAFASVHDSQVPTQSA